MAAGWTRASDCVGEVAGERPHQNLLLWERRVFFGRLDDRSVAGTSINSDVDDGN